MKRRNLLQVFLLLITCSVAISSCKKDKTSAVPVSKPALANKNLNSDSVATEKGIYTIYDGVSLSFCAECGGGVYDGASVASPNNISLSYFDLQTKQTTTKSLELNTVNFHLQNFKIYGSKMYVSYQNGFKLQIGVLNAATRGMIKQVDLNYNGTTYQQQAITFYKNYLLATTAQKSIAVMDTATLTVTHNFNIGAIGYQMLTGKDKLYILCNPYTEKEFIRVIDLKTFSFIKDISVLPYSADMGIDDNGKLYVRSPGLSQGQTGDPHFPGAGVTTIDMKTDQISGVDSTLYLGMTVAGNKLYLITVDNKVELLDAKTYTVINPNLFQNNGVTFSPEQVVVDKLTGYIYVYNNAFYDGYPETSHIVLSSGGVTCTRIYVFDSNYKQLLRSGLSMSPIQASWVQ